MRNQHDDPITDSPPPPWSPNRDRPPRTADRRLYTVRDAVDVLSISRSKVYELIATGDLPVVHIGRSVRITAATLDDFVDRLDRHSVA